MMYDKSSNIDFHAAKNIALAHIGKQTVVNLLEDKKKKQKSK